MANKTNVIMDNFIIGSLKRHVAIQKQKRSLNQDDTSRNI